MKYGAIGLCIILAFPVLVWAQLPYPFYKPITLDTLTEASLVAVALDADIYEVTLEDYANVRVVDGDDREVPYLLNPLDFPSGADLPENRLHLDRRYNVAGFEVVQDKSQVETHVIVRSRREPWTALILDVEDCNFQRSARVESDGDGRRVLAKGELTCFNLGGVRNEQFKLIFPEHRSAHYRVIIEDENSPPLKITGVRALGNVHRLFFIAEPGKTYRLYYGGPIRERPSWDVFAIQKALKLRLVPKLAALGEQQINENYTEPPRPWFWNRWPVSRMWLVLLAVLAVLLCWSLYYTARRLRWSSPGDRPDG